MPKINLTGRYRGKPVSTGIGTSSGGYPQFKVALRATEYYDANEKEWFDWSEQPENEITAYVILFSGDGKATASAKQIQKVFGWSGESFAELNNTDYSDIELQFEVGTHVYTPPKTGVPEDRISVDWIDTADAEPTRTISKATDEDIKNLDKAYAHGLRGLSGGKTVTPATKPKTTKPTAPKKKVKPETDESKPDKPAPKKPAPKATGTKKPAIKKCTKEQAWDMACEAKHESISDEHLEQTWTQTITDLGDEESFTSEDWYRVGKIVSSKVKDDIPF